jgi:predicted nucleotidyltransferase
LELDLVTHDVKKFFGLLLKRNGYVLELLTSPLVVYTSPEHEELKAIAHHCITRHHIHHYLGFAETQWKLFEKEPPPRVKPLLYMYRVLLTGIHLMRIGEVQANLLLLNDLFRLPYIPELVARKLAGLERSRLSEVDAAYHKGEFERLGRVLEETSAASRLPDTPAGQEALDELLVRIRMKSGSTNL